MMSTLLPTTPFTVVERLFAVEVFATELIAVAVAVIPFTVLVSTFAAEENA